MYKPDYTAECHQHHMHAIDLFGVYLYTMFAQAQAHVEPEIQVCKCMDM